MFRGELVLLIVFTCVAGLLFGLGIPLRCGWVPPNRLYGVRTTQTLRDPLVWYPVSRLCCSWLIVLGLVIAGVSIGTYVARIDLPWYAALTVAPLLCGAIAMAVHCAVASRRAAGASATPRLQFGLMALFVVTTITAIALALLAAVR